MKAKRAVEIKGSSAAVLRVVVRDGAVERLRGEIGDTIAHARPLLAEALTVLDLRERTEDGAGGILAAALDAGVRLAGVLVADTTDRAALEPSGLPLIEAPEPEAPAPRARPAHAPPPAMPRGALYLSRPLRSGQRYYAQGCDLVVLAPTSRGAELIADGSIYGFARLRGRVLAGASGDASARIVATDLDAELVAIAGVYRTLEAHDTAPLAARTVAVSLETDDDGGERLALAAIDTAQPQLLKV